MTDSKTATERLREMLDARGVEWKEHQHIMSGSMSAQVETLWGQPHDKNGKPLPHVYHNRATEMGDGRLFLEVQLATPEQAIAATLGSGECEMKQRSSNVFDTRKCSSCGEIIMCEYLSELRYCPNCGAKVIK